MYKKRNDLLLDLIDNDKFNYLRIHDFLLLRNNVAQNILYNYYPSYI